MKRSEEPLFLENSPLVFTLGVVQFDPVLIVAKHIPEIQESFRKKGYPKIRERTITHRISHGEGGELHTDVKKQWEFYNEENRTSVIVDQDSVIVQTTDYSTYEAFQQIITLALECAANLMGVSQVIRCGLRYIDIIENGEDSLDKWINVNLLGFPDIDGFARNHSHSSTELTGKDSSTLLVRCSAVPRGVVLPPDLIPCDIAFKEKPVRDIPFALLDLDHFSLKNFDYDLSTTIQRLSMLHDGLDLAFRESVTSHALKQWKTL